MPQNLTPKSSDVPHPYTLAPAGTKLLDPASLTLPDGGGPFVALPIETGGVRVRRLPAALAAELLAWTPPLNSVAGDAQARLATDEEVAEVLASGRFSYTAGDVPVDPPPAQLTEEELAAAVEAKRLAEEAETASARASTAPPEADPVDPPPVGDPAVPPEA